MCQHQPRGNRYLVFLPIVKAAVHLASTTSTTAPNQGIRKNALAAEENLPAEDVEKDQPHPI
ncbi:hypothetical protein CAI21_08660 [Alkalilimnicola ehrlichii]|uniref:Uncharacterized protein n=1 Tax=Alkalilimnicola ehrlichii TaxID=351052 RepID=A0A3E0WU26_9GAMM|nr:hypothetical protein CAI21_08660 [Alkalilimnicola ehrlichii]RFA36484.1 hypothetical protein CAL65_10930 [Alkalilimnicola ehrlichii]